MHRTNPLACHLSSHNLTAAGNLGANNRPDKHLRLQLAAGIIHIHPQLDRPCLRIKNRINKTYLPFEYLPRIGLSRKFNLLPVTNPRQIGFISIQLHPQTRKVRDRVNFCPRVDIHPFRGIFMNNYPAHWCINRYMVNRSACLFDFLDLLLFQSQQPQLLPRCFQCG